MKLSRRWRIVFWAFPLALLSTCAGEVPIPTPTVTPSPIVLSPVVQEATLDVGGLPTVTPDLGPQLGFPLGNPNLKASDPAGFTLAAGQPQFVELFAFW